MSDGPYIVTHCQHVQDARPWMDVFSRHAVATLDEEVPGIMRAAGANGGWIAAAMAKLRRSGGTVGPLPDGTVIEVSCDDSWQDVAHMAGLTYAAEVGARAQAGDEKAQREILDAYNARQNNERQETS